MPRPARTEIAGVPLHVVQRGNNGAACFFSDLDRRFYLKCLRESAARRGCEIHAYALMSNHVHLLLTPMQIGAASLMFQDLGRQYVRTINEVRGRTGTLWEGRFKSNLIDSETYLITCHRYIELNPVRAGMVERPADYAWSSHAYYASGKPDALIAEHEVYLSLGPTPERRRSVFVSLFRDPVNEKDAKRLRTAIKRGWALGSEPFLDRMEALAGRSVRPARRGRPLKQVETGIDQPDPQADMLL
ncbi:MAG: transposase [Burkholderiales bacterium]